MWEDALRVARENNMPDFPALKEGFMKHLVETGQEQRAAALKEKEGELSEAINLYMRAGLPTKAGAVLLKNPTLLNQNDLLERIASALIKGGLYEKAGELFEKVIYIVCCIEVYNDFEQNWKISPIKGFSISLEELKMHNNCTHS